MPLFFFFFHDFPSSTAKKTKAFRLVSFDCFYTLYTIHIYVTNLQDKDRSLILRQIVEGIFRFFISRKSFGK